MGRLDQLTDMTGQINAVDLNAQNIMNIIDELNRNADQLDAIGNSINIIGRGSLVGQWPGTGGINSGLTLQNNHGFQTAPIFLASYTRSDMTGSFPIPYWDYDNAGSLISRSYAYTDNKNIYFSFAAVNNGSPITFNFSYYIIQQPAQVPTGL